MDKNSEVEFGNSRHSMFYRAARSSAVDASYNRIDKFAIMRTGSLLLCAAVLAAPAASFLNGANVRSARIGK